MIMIHISPIASKPHEKPKQFIGGTSLLSWPHETIS